MTKDDIQQKVLKAIGNKKLAGCDISMGVGKTRIGLKDMASIYTDIVQYLVVGPKKTTFDEWENEIIKCNHEYLKPHINYSTYISLTKQHYDYDVVYLDECHSLLPTHNEWLKQYVRSGGRIIGLTGTYPISEKTSKGKMCNFYCPKVYEYHIDDAIADNLLNDYKIIIHKLKLSEQFNLPREGKHGKYTTSEMKEYNYWSDRINTAKNPKELTLTRIQRMKALQTGLTKEIYAKTLLESQHHKTILFANTKIQADTIGIHSYHSTNKDSKNNLNNFKKGTIIKLTAVEQLSEGVTIPNLKIGIIMHTYANNRKTAQKIGRLLRLNPEDEATIHILCYVNSIDKEWVIEALKAFNQDKIHWIDPIHNV